MSDKTDSNEKHRVSPEWNLFELSFLKKHTIDAKPGFRLSPKELARQSELSRRTKGAISTRIKVMGWADKEKSQKIRSGKRMSQALKEKLLIFLQNEGRFWPSSTVAKIFGLKTEQVRVFRARRGISIVHSPEAMCDPVYRKFYLKRERARVEALRKSTKEMVSARKDVLSDRLKYLIDQRLINWAKNKRCDCCGSSWPHTESFFWSRTKRGRKGERTRVLTRRCKGCLSGK